ncbi:hypothetical protein MPLSOD_340054 [Mesorhizobium sp. SOD10]|nr:hypothetical protein MPLSOD_340054 [Mesorhizobium sp. SOD10]
MLAFQESRPRYTAKHGNDATDGHGAVHLELTAPHVRAEWPAGPPMPNTTDWLSTIATARNKMQLVSLLIEST